MTRITLLYFPVNNNSKPPRIRTAPLKISWFEARCSLNSFHAISVPLTGSSGSHVSCLRRIRTDPAAGEERPGLCFTVGVRDLRKRPEAIARIEILIEKVRQG